MEAISTGTTWGPTFTNGQGAWLQTNEGIRFFDGTSGSGAASLGHQHPSVLAACHRQVDALLHTGCKLNSDIRARLARRISSIVPFKNAAVLFSVIGTEAVESAIKIARAATGRQRVAGLRHAYHGKSREALHVTWRPAFKAYSVIPQEQDNLIIHAPYIGNHEEDVSAIVDTVLTRYEGVLRKAKEDNSLPAALIMEPVQVTEGVLLFPQAFLEGMIQLSRQYGVISIIDEIYTGLGRCGALFYSERLVNKPDLLLMGKSLGNGLPISLVVGEASLINQLGPGIQTSTYSGHPLSCAAAEAVLDVVLEKKIWETANTHGTWLKDCLIELKREFPAILSVRQQGLLVAFDIGDKHVPSAELARQFLSLALSNRLILFGGGSHNAAIKLIPPILLADSDKTFFLNALARSLDALKQEV